jgi:hypothetical protein
MGTVSADGFTTFKGTVWIDSLPATSEETVRVWNSSIMSQNILKGE